MNLPDRLNRQVSSLLSAGIRVITTPVHTSENKNLIEMSSGITLGSVQYASLPYRKGAFVPQLPWRGPTNVERDLLLGTPVDVERGEWIQIIRLPEPILKSFESLRAASGQMTKKVQLEKYIRTVESQRAILYALRYIAKFTCAEKNHMEGVGIFGNPPGLPTTTEADISHLNGLHIDSWYNAPLTMRSQSPNRFSINLGLNDRFFLYVNLSLIKVARMLTDCQIRYDNQDKSTRAFREAFMTSFPDYPVVKLRIRPGEAYIAPTENLIHDGCTLGQSSLDVQLSVRGYFRPTFESYASR